jgi:uncharacterized lipoprotein
MKHVLLAVCAVLLLAACDTQSERDQAATTKLTAQAQLTRAESDAATAQALIDAQKVMASARRSLL